MNVKSVETGEKGLVTMVVEVEAQEFDSALQKAYQKNIMRMNVPGFRKGKAPRKMVEKMYGTGVFYEDAVNIAYPDAYKRAVDEKGLKPVEQADVDVKDISESGFTFEAKFHVRPDVTMGEYKGLKVKVKAPQVTDEDLNAELDKLLLRNARQETVDRESKDGDTVILDYEGSVDDVPFDGGKAEKQSLTLGSGRFIPGFEEQLIGKKAGDDCLVNVTFPEPYQAEELAGKEAVFKCHIHEVKETIKPELDDEFAKDVSEFDTLDEYKNSLREKMLLSREHEADHAFEDALVDMLIADMKTDVPDCMVNQQAEKLLQEMDYNLSRQGLNLKTYMEITGASVESLMEENKAIALRQVKASLAYEEIAKLEKLEVDTEELESEYTRLSEMYRMKVEDIKKRLDEKALIEDLLSMKAAELVKSTAIKEEEK